MAWTGRFTDFNFTSQTNSVNRKKCDDGDSDILNGSTNLKRTYCNGAKPTSKGHQLQGDNNKLNNRNITKLADINPSIPHPSVVGVVLAKEGPRSILSKKNPGSERHLLNFVIRDSPSCFANITCWGQELFIKDTARNICIGDVVQLSNVQIQLKQQDGYDERFKPATPVCYNITMSETYSGISSYIEADVEDYRHLQHIPTKASNDYYTLEDVSANGENLHGEHINLLVAVKRIGQPKDITTKNGKQTRRCELKLLDETCASFPLVLWNSEIIDAALTWTPLDTILFAADVKITYDNYRSSMLATADSKTIFTVNPDTLEAHSLYQYAHTQCFELDDGRVYEEKNLEDITDQFTIFEIKSKKHEMMTGEWKPAVYGYTYVAITHFDIDNDNYRFIKFRCQACRLGVTEETNFICNNPECTQGALNIFDPMACTVQYILEYSMMVSLSDHTGTVDMCHVDDTEAEKLIGMKATEFQHASIEKKTTLKWNILLEKCKVYFKLSCGGEEHKVFMKMLACV